MRLGNGKVWRPLASLLLFGLPVGFVDGWPPPHVATVAVLAALVIIDLVVAKLRSRKAGIT